MALLYFIIRMSWSIYKTLCWDDSWKYSAIPPDHSSWIFLCSSSQESCIDSSQNFSWRSSQYSIQNFPDILSSIFLKKTSLDSFRGSSWYFQKDYCLYLYRYSSDFFQGSIMKESQVDFQKKLLENSLKQSSE